MTKHYTIRISGKVQGVFFRIQTKEKADKLELRGVVQNNSDGSVTIEVEGEEDRVQELVSWCKEGPAHAQVDHINSKEKSIIEGYKDFHIKES